MRPEGGPRTVPMSERDARAEVEHAYARHYSGLLAFFCRRGVEREQARDLAQQTFLNAWRDWHTFRGQSERSTWLLRIAANLWKNSLRERHAVKRTAIEVSLDADPGRPPEPIDARTPGAEQVQLERERRTLVATAWQRLPPRMRRCLALHVEGLKYREIAVLLRISEGAVKSQIHQAKRRLRELLAELSAGGRV